MATSSPPPEQKDSDAGFFVSERNEKRRIVLPEVSPEILFFLTLLAGAVGFVVVAFAMLILTLKL